MLDWLYTAIASVMKFWHWVFASFLDPAGGITWALSIVFLVVTIRLLLFRLFIRQVKSQRAMQEIQPEIQQLRKQFGSDRQGFSQAVMALQKERGVNPLAGCLPILPQIPVFISLFHVLRRLTPTAQGLYGWSTELTHQAAVAKLFGVAPISSSLVMQEPKKSQILALPGVTEGGIRAVAIGLIIVMVVTSYYTQRQIMKRSGPVEGQAAMVQKLMLYGMPAGLLVSSSFFPIGVLLYWFTNNLWTLGQQFYILKKLPPPPGSPAAKALEAEQRAARNPQALAPKPGAKPVRGKGGRPVALPAADTDSPAESPAESPAAPGSDGASSPASPTAAEGPTADGTPGNGVPATGSSVPRPGARPAGRLKRKRR